MMHCRPLGASGLRVSELFLGAMTFADGFRPRRRRPWMLALVSMSASSNWH